MTSSDKGESLHRIADILGAVREKGVKIWSENGELRYKAPKGVLTREEIERLSASRTEIVTLLERSSTREVPEPSLESRRRFDRAPLTFSQLARWDFGRLSERPSVRQIASATRLCGRVHVDLLRTSLAAVVRRHEALRTRIAVLEGFPVQEIDQSIDCELRIDDVSGLSESEREAAVRRLIDQVILEPIYVTVGPLLGVRLAKLRENEHVLIVAMEHIISDAFSMNILLRDLFTLYSQALSGRAPSLPPLSIQFADYAVWQRNAQQLWIEKHGAYWQGRLAGCQRLRFPSESNLPSVDALGWGTIPVHISADLKAELREWSRQRGTTLVMSVFVAYVALVLRWCGASEAVFRYQTDGRVNPKVESTIGFFAAGLLMRIELVDDDTFLDLMNRIIREYCSAHEHADFCYLEAQVPRAGFFGNTLFNWVSQEPKSDLSALNGTDSEFALYPVRFEHPLLKIFDSDSEPWILFYDSDDEVDAGVHFPLNRFSVDTMQRFGGYFFVFLETLLRRSQQRVKDVILR